jgi:hypothetical protein
MLDVDGESCTADFRLLAESWYYRKLIAESCGMLLLKIYSGTLYVAAHGGSCITDFRLLAKNGCS